MSQAVIEVIETNLTKPPHEVRHAACPICIPPEEREIGREVASVCGAKMRLSMVIPTKQIPANACLVCLDLLRVHVGSHA